MDCQRLYWLFLSYYAEFKGFGVCNHFARFKEIVFEMGLHLVNILWIKGGKQIKLQSCDIKMFHLLPTSVWSGWGETAYRE